MPSASSVSFIMFIMVISLPLLALAVILYFSYAKRDGTKVAQVWKVAASTIERFLQEIAREKPIRFTANELCSFTRNYSKTLGAGGFGTVYEGQLRNGMKIAVKVLNRSLAKIAEEQFMAEVGTIGRTYHRNLVRLYGFCHDQFTNALVYEYMENGSLDRYLFNDKKEIEWEKLHDIAIGTARGIAYLHEECQHRIIHHDIKPANILLDANYFPKVADFGLAKLCNCDDTHVSLSGYRGTPGYSAPEFLLMNHPITQKCDVYSLGMVLFEIVGRRRNTNITPSESLDWFPKQVWDEFEKNELDAMTVACGIEEKDRENAIRMSMVALWCVQDSPEARPPMSVVVKMLDGGVEIMPPPKPFNYLYATGMNALKPPGTSDGSSNSYWYKDATPIMAKYEIQIATSLSRKDQSFKVAPCMKSLSMCYRKICILSQSSSQVEPHFMFTLLLGAVSSFTWHKILLIYMQRF